MMKNRMGYGKSALKVNQRDIILIKFPFSDLSGAKVRPALVISNQGYNTKSLDISSFIEQKSDLQEACLAFAALMARSLCPTGEGLLWPS
jgi:16S rRNA A1518/A1519 N6-dimethyltransferase RsmA/KsgA/DIM1 with predicted DNA glycosylase/AP lyase activity